MILTPSYDQEFCEAIGLNTDTGHLIDLVYKLPTWSISRKTSNGLYYFLDYGKIIKELPNVFKSKSKITRLLAPLIELGIIDCIMVKRSYYLRPSDALKTFWKKSKSNKAKNNNENCSKNETLKNWQLFVLSLENDVPKIENDVPKIEPIRTPAYKNSNYKNSNKNDLACSNDETLNSDSKQPKSKAVWLAYANAYKKRYGHEPNRSAKINKQLCLFVDEVGQSDAPMISEYYLYLNNNWYQQRGHDVATLLQNAQAIRTQWLNQSNETSIDHRTNERRSSTLDAANRVKAQIARGEL